MTDPQDDRISVRQNGKIIPIVTNVVHRNPELAKRGLLIEHHVVEKSDFPRREAQSHIIYLHTGPRVQACIEGPGVTAKRWLEPGMVWVMPHGSEHAVSFGGQVEGFGLSYKPQLFERLLQSANFSPSFQLQERIIADQPKLSHLMRALFFESLQPNEPSLLTAEYIASAIAMSLARPVRQDSENRRHFSLTPRQLQVIQTYVETNISETLCLEALAATIGYSVFHFLRAFKQTTGTTPHRYVMERRIDRAKALLRSSRHSIAEVGVLVGFAHQSHFARAFRAHVGVTPTSYLREI